MCHWNSLLFLFETETDFSSFFCLRGKKLFYAIDLGCVACNCASASAQCHNFFFVVFFCPLVDQIIFQYFIYWLCLQLQFVFYSFYLIFCLNLWLLCWSYLKVILYGRFFWDSFHWGGDVHSLEYWLKILCSNFLWNFSLIHKCRFNDFCSKNYFKWIKE